MDFKNLSINENFNISSTTNFYEALLHLVYFSDAKYGNRQELLIKQLEECFKDNGAKVSVSFKTFSGEDMDLTVADVGSKLSISDSEKNVAYIINKIEPFYEYLNSNVRDFVELEKGEEHLTDEEIRVKLIFALVASEEYSFSLVSKLKNKF